MDIYVSYNLLAFATASARCLRVMLVLTERVKVTWPCSLPLKRARLLAVSDDVLMLLTEVPPS